MEVCRAVHLEGQSRREVESSWGVSLAVTVLSTPTARPTNRRFLPSAENIINRADVP